MPTWCSRSRPTGEAPEGLGSTGVPRFDRLWTLLGLPAITVPGLTGSTGLPIGVQLVGRRGADALVLSCAAWLAAALPPAPGPDDFIASVTCAERQSRGH